MDNEEIVFDLIGAEPPLANALRRILIAEIPTIAIEKVNMWQNTSIIPDENLAHRVGLIPIQADPRDFEFHPQLSQQEVEDGVDPTTKYTGDDCIKFKLHVKCTKKDPRAPMVINNTVDEDKFYNNANVYASQLQWIPMNEEQRRRYPTADSQPKALYGDILVAKLRPGQEIEMELFCEKGIGKTHAKWSPVSTAYYRLVPDIKFKKEILNEDAIELKNLCPVGVFDIEDLGNSRKRAFVSDARKCTTCRECIRPQKFQDVVDLGKIKDRFEFHVESVGVYTPADLVVEALKKLKEKAVHWLEVLEHQDAQAATNL
jgi:DNA-directed RNA polymerase I and III subunit RPAC1